MILSKILLALIIQLLCGQITEGIFGRDWSLWTKARRYVNLEISDKRALGLHPLTELKDFDMFTFGFKISVNPLYGSLANMPDLNVINGKGITLKSGVNGKLEFEIMMPLQKINTCGLMISSVKGNSTDFISKVEVYWKGSPQDSYDIIARPDNGLLFYLLNLEDGQDKRVLLFDSVPAMFMKFVVYPKSNAPINFRLASINKCRFAERHTITDCGEKMDQNKKFLSLPVGVPISIKCPIDCVRTWPCWGNKIYSTDSPICWTAIQNFGKWGNGFYTIYKIDKVLYFRDQVNPLLNHGVYCRTSTTTSAAYTFDRKYYDFALSESIKLP